MQTHFVVGPGGERALARALLSYGLRGAFHTLEVFVWNRLPEGTAWIRGRFGIVQLTEARNPS